MKAKKKRYIAKNNPALKRGRERWSVHDTVTNQNACGGEYYRTKKEAQEVADDMNKFVSEVNHMKACNVEVGAVVADTLTNASKGRKGRVIYNQSRLGDEVVIVEWDDDYSVQAENINDLVVAE